MKLSPFIFLSLLFFLGHSQQKEKPYSYWFKKTQEFCRVNNDSMLFYSRKMQVSSDSPCEYINGLKFEANSIYFKRECDSSKKMCLKILKKLAQEASALSDSCFFNLKAHTLVRIIYAEKCQGNYSKALEYISEHKNLIKQYPQYSKKNNITNIYQSALIHIELEHFVKAINLLQKCIDIAKDRSDKLFLPSAYTALGNTYMKLYKNSLKTNYLDSSKIYYKKAYGTAIKIKKQTKYTQKLYMIKKGVFALYDKRFDSALFYIRKAKNIKLTEQKHFTNQEIDIYMSKAFYKLNQLDSSIYYGNQFLKKHTAFPRGNNLLLEAYTILANSYNKSAQPEEAYKHSSLALLETKKMEVKKISAIEKLNLLALNKIKDENQLLLSRKSEKWLIYKILITILIIFLIAFLFRSFILKKKINKKSKINDEKNNTSTPAKKNNTSQININENIVNQVLLGLSQLEKEKAFLKTDFSLQFIAQALNSNTSYISKIINHHTGASFKQYTNNLRIQYIIKELKDQPTLRKHSLDAISKDLGYSNASSFSKIFKKHTGVNPSDFIKELNQKQKTTTS